MATKRKSNTDQRDKEVTRASISFPVDDYQKLELMALEKRVSLAWVVREAVREYLESKQSLIGEL